MARSTAGAFDRGEAGARTAFEKHVDTKMKAYKEQRYSGLVGAGKWLKDKFLGGHAEENAFFQEGRQLYLNSMQTLISMVADVVGNELNRAKIRIAQGRQEIQTYVNGLPQDLRQVGQEGFRSSPRTHSTIACAHRCASSSCGVCPLRSNRW